MTKQEIFAAYFEPMESEKRTATDEEITAFFQQTAGIVHESKFRGLSLPSAIKISLIEGETNPWCFMECARELNYDLDDLADEMENHFERFWNGAPDAKWIISGFDIERETNGDAIFFLVCHPKSTDSIFTNFCFSDNDTYYGLVNLSKTTDSKILFKFADRCGRDDRAYILERHIYDKGQSAVYITEIINGQKTRALSAYYDMNSINERINWKITAYSPQRQ